MTKFSSNNSKPAQLTNQDVIDFITSIGGTVKSVTVENDKVISLEVFETTKDLQILTRYTELVKI